MIQPERIARLHARHADRLSSGRMGGVQEPQPDRWLHSAVFTGLVPGAALTLCRRELWEPRPMSIKCMGMWVCVEAHREHPGGKVRCSTRSLACLCMFISVCMPGCVSLCKHSEVCVFKFQICIHLGCACSQHERGRQRDGGRGKERLRLIILPLAGESCCVPLPSALPSSGD